MDTTYLTPCCRSKPILTTIVLALIAFGGGTNATAQNPQSSKAVGGAAVEPLSTNAVIGRLTRYAVKTEHLETFRKSLTEYVAQALADPENIQAEAYHDQDNPSILWLIERWNTRSDLDRFGGSPVPASIDSRKSEALSAKPAIYHVKDLEPLTKEAWRRAAKPADQPLTVMLFVDSKPGTQDEFLATYKTALPQFRSEPGVIAYQLSRVEGDAPKFVTYEKFRSKEAFQYHLNFPPIKPVLEYLETSIVKPPFQTGLHLLVEFAPMKRE